MTDTTHAPERIWPVGMYAPGGYTCTCTICGQHHIADKRAKHCADCTIQRLLRERDEARASVAAAYEAAAQAIDDAGYYCVPDCDCHGSLDEQIEHSIKAIRATTPATKGAS